MSKKCWTPDQVNAIKARGGSLLISAAAGSGKTAVLVERIIDRITDPQNPCNIDEMVVVTFTKAAANEIKNRVLKGLSERIRTDPENRHYRRQKFLLGKSYIGTMDAICKKIIGEHFFLLGISPDFSVGEEQELNSMRQNCMSRAMEDFYQGDLSGRFESLVNLISPGRNDQKLAETALGLFEFARSHPYSKNWLQKKYEMYLDTKPITQNIWGKILLDQAELKLVHASECLQEAVQLAAEDPKIKEKYFEPLTANFKKMQEIKSFTDSGSWDEIGTILRETKFENLKPLRNYEDPAKKEKISELNKKAKEIKDKLEKNEFSSTAAEFADDLLYLKEKTEVLIMLVNRFWELYDEAKRERNVVDFSDIIEMTIRLLTKPQEAGFQKTEVALRLSQQFKEILIDEYQDTNEAQDLVFRAISDNETNIVVVGDVKQSIYRFRQAMPELFLNKKKNYAAYDGIHYPATINLDKNFRSKRAVTELVNILFCKIMKEESGEIDYEGKEELIPAADYQEPDSGIAQIHMIVYEDDNDELKAETEFIGTKIKEIMETGLVEDSGQLRPVKLRDVCILLRAVKNKAPIIEKYLSEMGISSITQGGDTLFDTREVSSLISLLRSINNPSREIALCGAMMSPLYGFSAQDMAEIRGNEKRSPFYKSLVQTKEKDAKVNHFLRELSLYRNYATEHLTSELLEKIMEDHYYISAIGMLERPEVRIANVRLFFEFIKARESKGYKRLTDIVRYIDMLEEKNAQPACAPLSHETDAVRILSIHNSKGLEFPICFVADLDKPFNKQNERERALLHTEYGIATARVDEITGNQFKTLPYEAIKLAIDRDSVSEEMRLLYVAMTRAREQLYLTFTTNDPNILVKKVGRFKSGETISPYSVLSASSYSQWLILAVGNRIIPETPILKKEQFILSKDIGQNSLKAEIVDEKLKSQIREKLQYQYRFADLTVLPTKLSVSELTKSDAAKYYFRSRPAFVTGDLLSPAEIGNAVHKVMQFSDFKSLKQSPEQEIKRLKEKKFISEAEYDVIDIQKIRCFFESYAAKKMDRSDKMFREFTFISGFDPSEITKKQKDYYNEKVMIQGVVDCICVAGGKATIIDYKTDRVDQMEILKNRYEKQLRTYGIAVKEILGLDVEEHVIYSFHLGKDISF